MTSEFNAQFNGALDFSVRAPVSRAEQNEFLAQLARATGVYFVGGTQSRITAAFELRDGHKIKEALKIAYERGLPFAGTSAGTAIMSEAMINGNLENGVVPLARGLGLLPPDVIVDQHFSQRSRAPRLLQAQRQSRALLALGVDEDTALVLRARRKASVLGDFTVRSFYNGHEEIIAPGHQWLLPIQERCEDLF